MLSFIRSRQARQDLIDIWKHIARHDPKAASNTLDRIDAKCEMLTRHPHLGPAREDIRSGLRYLAIGQYVAVYSIEADTVCIIRILHARRDLEGLFTK